MLRLVFFFAAGLVVGWNFLPQPVFVKKIIDKIISLFSGRE